MPPPPPPPSPPDADPGREIDPAEAHGLLDRDPDRILLLDCRTPGERDVAAIQPSEHVPMAEVPSRTEDIAAAAAGRPIVVYCHHGVRSLRVTEALRAAGLPDVRSLAGGIDRWSREIDPAVPRY